MNNSYSKLSLLITLSMILTLMAAFNSANGQSERNPKDGLNVTQDMINLLLDNVTQRDPTSLPQIINNATNSTTEQQAKNHTDAGNIDINLPLPPIFLEDKTLPEGDIMYIYDITPSIIQQGHVTAKLPCTDDNLPSANILVGKMPDFRTLDLIIVPEFSRSGDLCLYQSNISSNVTGPASEVLLSNNSTDDIEFPATSSILLDIVKLTAKP